MNWRRLFSRRRLYGDLSAEIEEHLNENIPIQTCLLPEPICNQSCNIWSGTLHLRFWSFSERLGVFC